jgi:hypothetical protein
MRRPFNSISRMNAPNPLAAFLDAADPIYGTGVDGNAILDGTSTVLGMAPSSSVYQATQDLYFENLTIHSGVRLQPNGYRIFVKNLLSFSGNNATIGFNTGFATAGSIAQGGAILTAVTNSLGGSALNGVTAIVSVPPTAALGGAKYYSIPHNAVKGYAVTASSTTPAFLRGGSGGLGQAGGGIVILAARHISGPASGNAYIKAPATAPAGGGVVLIVSSAVSLPSNVLTDVTGQNPGTVNYMQLV